MIPWGTQYILAIYSRRRIPQRKILEWVGEYFVLWDSGSQKEAKSFFILVGFNFFCQYYKLQVSEIKTFLKKMALSTV